MLAVMAIQFLMMAFTVAATLGGSGKAPDLAAAPAPTPLEQTADVDPEALKAKVSAALAHAEGIRASDIRVSSHASTILLSGEVASEAEAARVLAAATAAAGGAKVSSRLEVREAAPQPALTSVRAVEQALKQDKRTANLDVTVSVDEDGVIGLHGLVPSAQDRLAAEQVASRVPAAKRLNNRLVVPSP